MLELSSDCSHFSPNVSASDAAVISRRILFVFLCFFFLSHNLSSKWIYSIFELFLKIDGIIPDVSLTRKDFWWIIESPEFLGEVIWDPGPLSLCCLCLFVFFFGNPRTLVIEEGPWTRPSESTMRNAVTLWNPEQGTPGEVNRVARGEVTGPASCSVIADVSS